MPVQGGRGGEEEKAVDTGVLVDGMTPSCHRSARRPARPSADFAPEMTRAAHRAAFVAEVAAAAADRHHHRRHGRMLAAERNDIETTP
jgi:hypothetical protein